MRDIVFLFSFTSINLLLQTLNKKMKKKILSYYNHNQNKNQLKQVKIFIPQQVRIVVRLIIIN